ncbi:MAG: 3-hydroxyacyl-ACP dehydratase FabZ [Bacillota bacterium]|nr:3-hydroxyacyl-ACP dehydratase FabZ [Bacillota bacterium]
MSQLDFPSIHEVIPHKYPFLLIDKILEVEPMKRCVGQKNVSYNDSFFQGHYPDYPVMPGVLIIEALAQLGAYLVLSHENHRGSIPLFRGIEKAKFKRQVVPGDVLELQIELIERKGNFGFAKAQALVDNSVCCYCELSFFIK